MDLDLETFLITLYVISDDWHQKVILPKLPVCGGPAPKNGGAPARKCVWRKVSPPAAPVKEAVARWPASRWQSLVVGAVKA